MATLDWIMVGFIVVVVVVSGIGVYKVLKDEWK
jgi:hypothetical protein